MNYYKFNVCETLSFFAWILVFFLRYFLETFWNTFKLGYFHVQIAFFSHEFAISLLHYFGHFLFFSPQNLDRFSKPLNLSFASEVENKKHAEHFDTQVLDGSRSLWLLIGSKILAMAKKSNNHRILSLLWWRISRHPNGWKSSIFRYTHITDLCYSGVADVCPNQM